MSKSLGRGGRTASVDEALLNHLSLPPKLPQQQDNHIEDIETALVDHLVSAAKHMRDLPMNPNRPLWASVYRSLIASRSFVASGRLERSSLLRELRDVAESDFLFLHVRSQNAAVSIWRYPDLKDSVVFEVFEASPRCTDVLAAADVLQFDFLGAAVAIPLSVYQDESFLTNLASFFEQASLEKMENFSAHTHKAGIQSTETRDTRDPSLISSMLVALLEGNGKRISPTILRKRVRDDVVWKNAEMPWRRLPLWLIARVVIRRFLSFQLGGEGGRIEFKFFVCVVLANFMKHIMYNTSSERLIHLKAKLCRRLSKLEVDKIDKMDSSAPQFNYLFANLTDHLRHAISQACNHVDQSWEQWKAKTTRQILTLPKRLDDRELLLSLRLSGAYLRRAMSRYQHSTMRAIDPNANSRQKSAKQAHLSTFPEPYFKLAEAEEAARQLCEADMAIDQGESLFAEIQCTQVAEKLRSYLNLVSKHYDGNAEQRSTMLLTTMELWVRLDKCACSMYPLLKDFHPWFHPRTLDVLHVLKYRDMVRLCVIQEYLRERIEGCRDTRLTIFDDPTFHKGCFAERYFDESPVATNLQALVTSIELLAAEHQENKEREWERLSNEYEQLTKMIDESSCIYITDENNPLGRGIHDRHCPRCQLERRRSNMRIGIFEHPLPTDDRLKKVVAFELGGFHAFEVYRDITWHIVVRLSLPETEEHFPPKCSIHTYSELGEFVKRRSSKVVLSSNTKSFLNTHYSKAWFPVDLDSVCKPNGLRYGYYDEESKTWPGRISKIQSTFDHHCRLSLPANSPLKPLELVIDPTSYDIVASQSGCPTGVSVHEYLAFQTLLSGQIRRWITILTELGSSNLNFSSEATSTVLIHLAHLVGPSRSDGHPLRAVHHIFTDDLFCQRLRDQLSMRLQSLEANWREVYLMYGIINVLLRMFFSTETTISLQALGLIVRAREISLRWMTLLREETQRCKDAEMASRCQTYTLWAAALCLSTFQIQDSVLDDKALRIFVECSITLHNNLPGDPKTLPLMLKTALVSVFKTVFDMQTILCQSFQSKPGSLIACALANVWPEPAGMPRTVVDYAVADPHWLFATIVPHDDQSHSRQKIRYNYLYGLLLVNETPLGQLPAKHQKSLILRELFGEQNVLTCSSSFMPSMTYQLLIVVHGYQVHIGFDRDIDHMVIRVCRHNQILELVPREVFGTPRYCDLPAVLTKGNFHWLDLTTGKLEIRPNPWFSSPTNWTLDIRTGQCSRVLPKNKDYLVDPHHRVSHRIARNLDGFEFRQYVMTFQRTTQYNSYKSLFVELRRLQLTFYVSNGTLYSPALRAEIDHNQDAGTFYGLQSKMVLRERGDGGTRMILVPLGELTAERYGSHVIVRTYPRGDYLKFTINQDLGRLDCAAEAMLIYRRVQFHAYTSGPVPDPLTGRTGTDEALRWLAGGIAQPWMPLQIRPVQVLGSIAHLSPVLTYYPEDMKVMKSEVWDAELPASIQHPAFRVLVKQIIAQSEDLRQFYLQPKDDDPTHNDLVFESGDSHLNLKAWVRRSLTSRRNVIEGITPTVPSADSIYSARDRSTSSRMSYSNVLEAVSTIRKWPGRIMTETKLASMLSRSNMIGGYDREFDKHKLLLSERLNVNICREWGSMVKFAQTVDETHKFSMMFVLAPVAFRFDANMSLIRTIIAFGIFDELKKIPLPTCPEFTYFQPDDIPQIDYLVKLMKPFRTKPPEDQRHALREFMSSKELRKMRDAEEKHQQKGEEDCRLLAQFFLLQWPCAEPSFKEITERKPLLVDAQAAMTIIKPEWLRWYQNKVLSDHLQAVQLILERRRSETPFRPPQFFPSSEVLPCRNSRDDGIPELARDLMTNKGPLDAFFSSLRSTNTGSENVSFRREAGISSTTEQFIPPRATQVAANSKNAIINELGNIIDHFTKTESTVRRRYGEDLRTSLSSFAKRRQSNHQPFGSGNNYSVGDASKHIQETEIRFERIKIALEVPRAGSSERHTFWLVQGGLFPVITPSSVLEQLRSTSPCHFGSGMKESIIKYGVALTALQRERRLKYLEQHSPPKFMEEVSVRGHENWKPEEHPDWLLLEIELNVLIRPNQVDVALATIAPESASNALLQMNMGLGKTSVIIPMVALVLANGSSLCRVVIPRTLLQQTAQLLHSRLGGLLGRSLKHVPFSRRTPTNECTIQAFHTIHRSLLKQSGIMLCVPDHLLSFKLSGQQRLLDGKVSGAIPMIKIQSWLLRTCRDVLDESDHTLAVRTQLIYPSGEQLTVDGHPHRWLAIEAILKLVDLHLDNLQKAFPRSIEVVRRPNGGFPFIFFLRNDVEQQLLKHLVHDICRGNGGILPISRLDREDREAIRAFISEPKVSPEVVDSIRTMCPDRVHIRQTVFLLRGLIVQRILIMTLRKRWNVSYGLHPDRPPIAVPFHSKGMPSNQSEWGHPDVAILFTTLSLYIEGLSPNQLQQTLENVLKSDDPGAEYQAWVQTSQLLPGNLREWNSINLEDEAQLQQLHGFLRHNLCVVDYFLNNMVFPRHAKQLKIKLQASGWDLPIFQTIPGSDHSLTTGFSGTNDNRSMLPLTIQQHDLPSLSHTSAEVLTYLLDKKNHYAVIASPTGHRLSEPDFLRMLHRARINILIDSGAQILELDNLSLVKSWLEIDEKAPAALYFDEANKPWIISKQGRRTPLIASTFADNLERCLIYIDESHTRGTDLHLPTGSRGALTLGLGQTKDHTVQGAMRLRQLATTQSITFFAPPEVNQSILDLRGKTSSVKIDSADVIHWLLANTCDGIEQLQPLYNSQGNDFCQRMQAENQFPEFLVDKRVRMEFLAAIRREEQQTLQQLYEPKMKIKSAADPPLKATNPAISAYLKELTARRKAFQDTGGAVHGSALQEVEQEREVAFEVETVRQIKKAPRYAAHNFSMLDPGLKAFALTGQLAANSNSYHHILLFTARTSLGRKVGIRRGASSSKLFVSAEFEKTIKTDTFAPTNDNYMRPVNWIMWSKVSHAAIIVIPEEAEQLIPLLRETGAGNPTYLLTYAAPITRKMLHFNDLNYYSIPALPDTWHAPEWLKVELGIFAGRLHFEWQEYAAICKHLGIQGEDNPDVDAVKEEQETGGIDDIDGTDNLILPDSIQTDNMVNGSSTERSHMTPEACSFTTKPLQFMQEWLAIRRRGQDFNSSPMGYITEGRALDADHSFFRKLEVDQQPSKLHGPAPRQGDTSKEELIEDDGADDIMCAHDMSDGESDNIEYESDEMYSSGEEEPVHAHPPKKGRK